MALYPHYDRTKRSTKARQVEGRWRDMVKAITDKISSVNPTFDRILLKKSRTYHHFFQAV